MDITVPTGAAFLLDFIASKEAPLGYETVYGNNQSKLKKPITMMALDELIAAQRNFTRRFGSSACGRYQFMRNTLIDLKAELGLTGKERFDPDLQDRLGYHLLVKRGYHSFADGVMSVTEFGKRIAMEWASFPVLAPCNGQHRKVTRGQSYYAGDGMNKALVMPVQVEDALRRAYRIANPAPLPPPKPKPKPIEAPEPQIEDELRREGSRTINNADDIAKKSGWSRFWAFLTGGGGLSAIPYFGQLPLAVQLVIIFAVIAAAAIFYLEWRKGRNVRAIIEARVSDAKSGLHLGRLSDLRGDD